VARPAAHTAAKRPLVLCDPRLDPIEPGVTLGKDESQPDDHHASETQSRPIAIGREVFVDPCIHTHLFELREDDRYIVYSLVLDCHLFAHLTSVSQYYFSRDYSRERAVIKCSLHCGLP
jgi:hypothetical protein